MSQKRYSSDSQCCRKLITQMESNDNFFGNYLTFRENPLGHIICEKKKKNSRVCFGRNPASFVQMNLRKSKFKVLQHEIIKNLKSIVRISNNVEDG